MKNNLLYLLQQSSSCFIDAVMSAADVSKDVSFFVLFGHDIEKMFLFLFLTLSIRILHHICFLI